MMSNVHIKLSNYFFVQIFVFVSIILLLFVASSFIKNVIDFIFQRNQ